jgi:hypothetical protein
MSGDKTSRDQFLHYLFTTALEGGIGYWSQAESYRWSVGDSNTDDLKGFKAVIIDTVTYAEVDGEPASRYTIDRAVIAKGLNALAKGTATWGGKELHPSKVAFYVGLAATNGDGADWDANTADEVVQAGLFNDVRYG